MPEVLTFEPVDVVIPRGNRLFGGGVHGHAAMPPWPSLFTGAIASRALVDAERISDATARPDEVESILTEVLGESFSLISLCLERNGEPLFPLPADLVAFSAKSDEPSHVSRIAPRMLGESDHGVAASVRLPVLPVLEEISREKPMTGLWITASGLSRHLAGSLPGPESLATTAELWKIDHRLGIALDRNSRTAADGDLYTTDAVVLHEGVRFVAGFEGNNLPSNGLVRLGGDGRGAKIARADKQIVEELNALGRPKSGWKGFRMVMATPGIFTSGWLPPGVDSTSRRWQIGKMGSELVAACVPHYEVISGWDLARHAPKPARKVVPAGSVYWFRVLEGDSEALESVRRDGLLALCPDNSENRARRREGYGRVWFGAWEPKEV